VLSWIDICAGLAAKTFSHGPCVTASGDAVHFLRPCHVRPRRRLRPPRPPPPASPGLCCRLNRQHAVPAQPTRCVGTTPPPPPPQPPHTRTPPPGLLPPPPPLRQVGSVVVLAAMVNRTFRSSMEVGVRVEEEDARTGARHHCCSAYLTFVALARSSPGGGPPARRVLPRVVPTDRHHEEIHAEAARRWAARSAGAACWLQWLRGRVRRGADRVPMGEPSLHSGAAVCQCGSPACAARPEAQACGAGPQRPGRALQLPNLQLARGWGAGARRGWRRGSTCAAAWSRWRAAASCACTRSRTAAGSPRCPLR
jgi:acyl-CoA hydrolase